ncbi:MAG: hypothetical protein ONB05_06265 [candidate division KSB1 bacterium]|nr:hypothetical protein [candidate division KSB1 bacterium]
MKIHNEHQPFFTLSMLVLILILFGFYTEAQADGKLAIIKVNRVVVGVYDHGSTWQQTPTYSSGWFPADYNCIGTNCNFSASWGPGTFSATNCYAPKVEAGKVVWQTYPYVTYTTYKNSSIDPGDIVTVPMTNYVRWPLPTNYAKGIDVQITKHWGTPDASKMIGTSDQVVEVTTKNIMGLEVHRKLFAWSQQYHDNYVVCDYTITNRSGKTYTDFWLRMCEAYTGMNRAVGSNPEIPSGERPSSMAWAHYYGAKPGDSLRIFYEYSADDPDRPGDQMGYPVYSQDGRLTASDIPFLAILHASERPYTNPADDIDDPKQPTMTAYFNGERITYSPMPEGELQGGLPGESSANIGWGIVTGLSFQDQYMEGQYEGTRHRKNSDEMGSPDYTCLGYGFDKNHVWNRRYLSFGGYPEFKDGESIHIVFVTGYCGLGLKKAKEVGEKWLNGTIQDPPGIPNPHTGFFPENFAFPPDATEKDKIKDRWISTVIDSVHKTVSRAKWNFEHNWQVPMAPPPTNQWVLGTGAGIEITWSNPEAEALPNFDGYRIMRSVGYVDTVFFEEVHRTDATDKKAEHHWADPNVVFGASYYYYVQAGVKVAEDDPNADPITRGKTLWSGRMWSTTNNPVESERLCGALDSIRIVPNPYNLRDPLWTKYGLENLDDPRRIMFFNLPPVCTIKIFTENLDLVKTIEHTEFPVSTGYEKWDMLTENQQAIASGVYIVVFQTPDGGVSYQKLLVAR